jgi:hypothetical protein
MGGLVSDSGELAAATRLRERRIHDSDSPALSTPSRHVDALLLPCIISRATMIIHPAVTDRLLPFSCRFRKRPRASNAFTNVAASSLAPDHRLIENTDRPLGCPNPFTFNLAPPRPLFVEPLGSWTNSSRR